ncbi:MAG: ChaN family lipoprotein [Planctomycetota bacterium]|nr:ChaN family lipoprotein [Planctomycetota bacterium]
MSSQGVPARIRLLQLQRRLADEARQEIEASFDDPTGSLSSWRNTYQQATKGSINPISLKEIARQASRCDVIYFGDYHSLRESQKGPLRVIEKLLELGKKVVLCSEAFHIDSQPAVDRWVAMEITEEQLLSQSNWDQRWGFPWRNYSLQMSFFKDQKLPIVALNSDHEVVGDSFAAREKIAAMRIIETMTEHPDAILAVVFGDLHVAPDHLPAQVSRLATESSLDTPSQITIFQNVDRVYWELAETEQEQQVKAVQIGEDRYCLMNTTPLVKFQSYLNWQFNEAELEESEGVLNLPSISSSIMTDQIWMLIETIREYLGIEATGLDGYTVHTSRDLDLLDRLQNQHQLDESEMELVRTQLEKEESCYLPRVQIIVLGNLSIRHATEEATHHMNFVLCNDKQRNSAPEDCFFEAALRETIGYIGTKIIDHKRTCLDTKELESFAQQLQKKTLSPLMSATLQSVEDSLRYIEEEKRWLAGGGNRPDHLKMSSRNTDIVSGTAHAIGYRLGEYIYRSLVAGTLARSELRELFKTSLYGPGTSREVWFQWARRAQDSSSSGNSRRG